MNKVKAFIERGNDGTYGVYVDLEDNSFNYYRFGLTDFSGIIHLIPDFLMSL
ncbi:hypothetical protein FACS189440_09740 [Bacteroidia bacterium]|nr:hypothetical protein FACS189423_00400 [Bacteroidia bacterium]GHT47853.1 hypothetical protein FACS189440_09740 [Bacteroidia bacterium]